MGLISRVSSRTYRSTTNLTKNTMFASHLRRAATKSEFAPYTKGWPKWFIGERVRPNQGSRPKMMYPVAGAVFAYLGISFYQNRTCSRSFDAQISEQLATK